ncbi:MAG: hypothetical protein EXS36_12345 [Pedosphaera sp.]|nr:hypothetical protein [Pedosphaera sp.]
MSYRFVIAGILFTILPAIAADATNDPARLLQAIVPSMVRVEMDLQFDKGQPPTGVMDQDPGGGAHRFSTLAQLVEQERPLETTGYVLPDGRIAAMDPNIHPRFVKSIRVLNSGGQTTATLDSQARDHWAMLLRLKDSLPGAKPLQFTEGKPSHIVTYYRTDGVVLAEAVAFTTRIQQPDHGPVVQHIDSTGVAVTAEGHAVGLVFSRRLPADNSWQGSIDRWKLLKSSDFAALEKPLARQTREWFPRVRLSFRSPKQSFANQRIRAESHNEEPDADSTERDALGMLLPGNKVLVLAPLRSTTTARLEKITVFSSNGTPVIARFAASLKDFGALVATLETPAGAPVALAGENPFDLIGRLLLRADMQVQGENRSDYYHTARIATWRIGSKIVPYPELIDMSDASRTYLFNLDRQLVALPVVRRDPRRVFPMDASRMPPVPMLTPASLLLEAALDLTRSGDPANVPVSEADESRLAWLGAELQPLSRELARANGVADQTRDGETGVLVTYVHLDSPAARAGIQPGAILLRLRATDRPLPIEVDLEEDELRSSAFPWDRLDEIREQFFDRLPTPWPPAENRFTRSLTDLGFGTKYTAEFVIDGKLESKEFEVVQAPVHYEAATRFKSEPLGITVRNLTYDVRRYLQRKLDEPGVVVSKIEAGGKASVAGVKPYELITHVNDQPISSVKDFEERITVGGDLKLSIKRMVKGRIVTLHL